jgi:hypothetical protein
MGPDKNDLKQAIFAGFVATAILAILMYLAPLVGLPRIDLAAALSKPFAGSPATPLTEHWWLGLAIFFLFGSVVSPYVFALAYHGLLGKPWVRGIEWGFVVWVFGGVAVMTAMGLGFDEAHFAHPFSSVLSSLAGHMVYGAILGGIAGRILAHLNAQPSGNASAQA